MLTAAVSQGTAKIAKVPWVGFRWHKPTQDADLASGQLLGLAPITIRDMRSFLCVAVPDQVTQIMHRRLFKPEVMSEGSS